MAVAVIVRMEKAERLLEVMVEFINLSFPGQEPKSNPAGIIPTGLPVFFHPDYTVGSGITPFQPCGLQTILPVRSFTLP